MAKKKILELGTVFGFWTVVGDWVRFHRELYWECRCKCGVMGRVSGSSLRMGKSKSCKSCTHKKHGCSKFPEHAAWRAMRLRCLSENSQNYYLYGGRGIKICDRWLNSFENFYSDMGPRPVGYQIDRTNNDGNYEPSNCKWVTPSENSNNRRTSKKNLQIIKEDE